MTVGMDLGWRELRSVGDYSKQRIRNYEYANVLALAYDSGSVPATDTLLADLYRGIVLLNALYGDTLLAIDSALPPSAAGPDAGEIGTNRVQALLREATIRRAVEIHAEDSAESYFRGLGWSVERVGSQKLGYDLECVNSEGARLHAEVKGTQGLGEEVFLTRNEASHNGLKPECDAGHALYVLSGIKVSETANVKCTGGTPYCRHPWTVDESALTPTVYAYRVPRP